MWPPTLSLGLFPGKRPVFRRSAAGIDLVAVGGSSDKPPSALPFLTISHILSLKLCPLDHVTGDYDTYPVHPVYQELPLLLFVNVKPSQPAQESLEVVLGREDGKYCIDVHRIIVS